MLVINRVSAALRRLPGRVLGAWRSLDRRLAWGGVAAAALVGVGMIFLLAGPLLRPDDSLARIRQAGAWRVGMDPSFPPFENLDGSGKPVGFDVDLAQAIAGRWGVRVEIVPMGFDQILDAVSARQVDSAISGLPVVDDRTKEVSFSASYIEAGLVLAVPRAGAVRGQSDLAGRRLAAEWGSEGDAAARTLQKELPGGLQLVLRDTAEAALQAVASGDADAAVVDAVSLALYRGAGDLVIAGPPLRSNPYVVVVPARSSGLLGAVNAALAGLEADGTLPELRAKWFGPALR